MPPPSAVLTRPEEQTWVGEPPPGRPVLALGAVTGRDVVCSASPSKTFRGGSPPRPQTLAATGPLLARAASALLGVRPARWPADAHRPPLRRPGRPRGRYSAAMDLCDDQTLVFGLSPALPRRCPAWSTTSTAPPEYLARRLARPARPSPSPTPSTAGFMLAVGRAPRHRPPVIGTLAGPWAAGIRPTSNPRYTREQPYAGAQLTGPTTGRLTLRPVDGRDPHLGSSSTITTVLGLLVARDALSGRTRPVPPLRRDPSGTNLYDRRGPTVPTRRPVPPDDNTRPPIRPVWLAQHVFHLGRVDVSPCRNLMRSELRPKKMRSWPSVSPPGRGRGYGANRPAPVPPSWYPSNQLRSSDHDLTEFAVR